MSAHTSPLHCPYCGGEQLHPHAETHGAWECRECQRAFSIRFLGLLSPRSTSSTTATPGATDDTR
jgi:hypothetical protein